MAQQNQLLFNLNVPYNPMKMVTQFHNPGPIVIERLTRKHQGDRSDPSGEASEGQQKPVQFSVVSKEKLSFAMQLARRDMKNKIREQQHQHVKQQQLVEKDGSPRPKKGVKKKNVNRKPGRYQQPLGSPDRGNTNKNVNRKSIKTQTPPSSKYPSWKGSPVLVLQTKPQAHPGENAKSGSKHKTIKAESAKIATSNNTKVVDVHQKQEIARLNRELETCVERINALSKQVSGTPAASSPDRTATLRAGLEALMRAERAPLMSRMLEVKGQRSDVPTLTQKRQRKPLERKAHRSHSSGLILPMSMRSKHRYTTSASAEEAMHFIRPTESSKSKARAAREIMEKVASRSPPRGTEKPVWAPPGSPHSLHRVTSSKVERPASSLGYQDEEDEEMEAVGGRVSRETIDQSGRREDQFHGQGKADRKVEARGLQQRAMWVNRGNSYESRSRRDSELRSSEGAGTQMTSHSKRLEHMRTRDNGHVRSVDESVRTFRSQSSDLGEWDRELKPMVRRRVQFGEPSYSSESRSSSIRDTDRMRQSPRHGTSRDDLERVRGRPESGEESKRRHNHSYSSLLSGHHEGKMAANTPAAKPTTFKNTKEQITDLLVDDILEDAVGELERIGTDAITSRQAQMMEDAPTFENILKDLEYMEVEEEQIRRRWKHIHYDDPHVSRPVGGQRSVSDQDDVWMKGSPLDAQQMERLDEIPVQHTAMRFTKSGLQGSRNGSNVMIHAAARPNEDSPDDVVKEISSIGPPPPTRLAWHAVSRQTDSGGPQPGRGAGEEGQRSIPVFVPSEMMKRVKESREAFETHLKRTSHLPYGSFDPWLLVEKISDELVDDIISDITEEVGDVVGNYVEFLYEAEFDVKPEDSSLKSKAKKSPFT